MKQVVVVSIFFLCRIVFFLFNVEKEPRDDEFVLCRENMHSLVVYMRNLRLDLFLWSQVVSPNKRVLDLIRGV